MENIIIDIYSKYLHNEDICPELLALYISQIIMFMHEDYYYDYILSNYNIKFR